MAKVPVERLVIFSILMQNGDGIIAKSPDYIQEKYSQALTVPYPENLLDLWSNKAKLNSWVEKWREK